MYWNFQFNLKTVLINRFSKIKQENKFVRTWQYYSSEYYPKCFEIFNILTEVFSDLLWVQISEVFIYVVFYKLY